MEIMAIKALNVIKEALQNHTWIKRVNISKYIFLLIKQSKI